MNYIFSDKELKRLIREVQIKRMGIVSRGYTDTMVLDDFLESKKPITLVAEGIFGKCSGVVNSINDVEIWNGDKLIEKLEGKRAKLYMEEI